MGSANASEVGLGLLGPGCVEAAPASRLNLEVSSSDDLEGVETVEVVAALVVDVEA
jgi:hypothetical protein